MALADPPHPTFAASDATEGVRRDLRRARRMYFEDPAGALDVAIHGHEIARSRGDAALCARALALQGTVSLHRGDLSSGLALAVDAEQHCGPIDDAEACTEVAVLKAQLSFFTGSYTDALSHAERAIELADATEDADLRIFARRATCLVFGNVGVPDWRDRLEELLRLTIDAGDRWEEAISRNDLAFYFHELGELEAAETEIERALAVVGGIPSPKSFALAVLHSTRADIRLQAGRAGEALADAEYAIGVLTEGAEPNPYVLGITVRAEVQALMALGHFDDAQQSGETALTWLGDRVPQTRSLILATLAATLREAGRVEDAYEALDRAAELEREAFRELSVLQLRLERAKLEAGAARRESDSLAAKNRQLEDAHAELERRTRQLEGLQEQLRDQADRDWLTGLYNRRYLERLTRDEHTGPWSLAVLDLDHFKSINDRFGHSIGDQVLVRVAHLLCDGLREADVVVRSGGEEFLVLMPDTDSRDATACCERLRVAIRGEPWGAIAFGLVVTTSVGVACAQDPSDLESLVRLADQRLYEAKHAGRDRVVATSPSHRRA